MPGGVPDLTPRFSLNWSPKVNNWERVGGLPDYIKSFATAIMDRSGLPRSSAIPIAYRQVEKIALTGRALNLKGKPRVSAAVRSAAIAAVAEWKSKVARM